MAYRKRKFSSYRAGRKTKYRGKSRRTRKQTNFNRKVKKAVLKTAETKFFNIGLENEQLYHNCGSFELLYPGYVMAIDHFFNPWLEIVKGTARDQRIGDKIVPVGIKLNLWIANKYDRPCIEYRVIVAELPRNIGADVTTSRFNPFQVPDHYAEGNVLLLPRDSDRGIRFLYDKIIKMEATGSANWSVGGIHRETHKTIKLYIKQKRGTITYNSSVASITAKPLAVYVIPYEQYSTLNTDNIASCAGYMTLIYKDP